MSEYDQMTEGCPITKHTITQITLTLPIILIQSTKHHHMKLEEHGLGE